MNKGIVAQALIDTKAVYLSPSSPFVWASGIVSPIYCDNRLVLSNVAAREVIEDALCALIRTHFSSATFIAGTATAGIAHAAICAHKLALPMGYVRTQAKQHGRLNRIEGNLTSQDKVVVVEDLISTGTSCIETANAITASGATVLGVVSIFTYGMKSAQDNFASANLAFACATDFSAVIELALSKGQLTSQQAAALYAFRDEPTNPAWQKMF